MESLGLMRVWILLSRLAEYSQGKKVIVYSVEPSQPENYAEIFVPISNVMVKASSLILSKY